MTSRLARALVRLYPRTWRIRYEREMLALIDESGPTFRRAVDLFAGATTEWARAVFVPEVTAEALRAHPTLVRFLRFMGGTSPFVAVVLWRLLAGLLPTLPRTPFGPLMLAYFALLLVSFVGMRRLGRNLSFLGPNKNGSMTSPVPRLELFAWFNLFGLTNWLLMSQLSGASPWFMREMSFFSSMLMPCFSLIPHVIEPWFMRVTGKGIFYKPGPQLRWHPSNKLKL